VFANPCLRGHVLALLTIFVVGCVVIPIPSTKESVVSGTAVPEGGVQTIVSIGSDMNDVKARLGEPIIDFGPRRVFVYQWAISKGNIVWILAGPVAMGAVDPWIESHLLFIAFDRNGKVLRTGTAEFHAFESIAAQLREWLASGDSAVQIVGPRPRQATDRAAALFVYRPTQSRCPLLTYDASIFKPSVVVDGIVAGDLAIGEYLGYEMGTGAHVLVIDPVPDYRDVGRGETSIVQNLRAHRDPATLHISSVADQDVFVEAYLCTGTGRVETHAVLRDTSTALQALGVLRPAW